MPESRHIALVKAQLALCDLDEREHLARELLDACPGFLEITQDRKRRVVTCEDLSRWLGSLARTRTAGASS